MVIRGRAENHRSKGGKTTWRDEVRLLAGMQRDRMRRTFGTPMPNGTHMFDRRAPRAGKRTNSVQMGSRSSRS